jgi:hypothetical protein
MIKALVIMTMLISSAIIVLPLVSSFSVYASTNQPQLYPPNNNKSLGIKWWQWLFSIPKDKNPILDNNACDVKQSGPFFYLVGLSSSGSIERTCTIPQGKIIFFPVVNTFQTLEDNDNFDTVAEVRKAVTDIINKASNLHASVDGANIKLDNLRAQSALFPLRIPENNYLGAPPDIYYTVTDGYWVGLKPLSVGKHEIAFSGEIPGVKLDVKYHITIR